MPTLQVTEQEWEYLERLMEGEMRKALDRRNVRTMFQRSNYGETIEAHCRESLWTKLRIGPPPEKP